VPVNEDPVFRVSEIDAKLKRIDSLWSRLNAIPKPKEPAAKKNKKMPKNIKIDNMTFDGSTDFNLDDLINAQGEDTGDEDYSQKTTNEESSHR